MLHTFIISSLVMTGATALSQTQTKPWWIKYKQNLRNKGAMDIKRPIRIKGVNLDSITFGDERLDDDKNNYDNHLITTKIIHFQRHGQGYHNLLMDFSKSLGNSFDIDDTNPQRNPLVKSEIQDSPLTLQGRLEASAQRTGAAVLTPQVVIVSPLHRAIQTALISFADHYQNDIPFLAHEGCREQLGLLVCNKALPLSQTITEFPGINFDFCWYGEHDTLWKPEAREHPVDEANRAYEFLTEFVMKRQEEEMAVVCHSAFLFSLCNAVMDCGDDESLQSWFDTGEIRSLRVSFYKE